MDKYEYNLKLDQMKSLCAEEHYAAAAEIADTFNWNKIKNVSALVTAGEIYEKLERYSDSRKVLTLAFDRSPIGRTIIFRLTEVAIKMKDFDAAADYYNEFVDIAPHDNMRYVLQYDMKKAQGAEYADLIPILEELKEVEYTEEWAYELAYLYHKAAMTEKCVDACDELILWFGDGPYVERALELKMIYQPLTRAQEEKYRRFRLEKQGITAISAEEMERAGEYVHAPVEIPEIELDVSTKFNTLNLQREIAKGMQQIMNATEKTTVSDTIDNIKKIVEDIPYLKIPPDKDKEEDEPYIETDQEINDSLEINFQEMLGEDADGQMSIMTSDQSTVERQITGQMTIEEIINEWERTRSAAEKALEKANQKKLKSAKARALHEARGILDRLNEVKPKLDAGVSPAEILREKYMEGITEETIEAVRKEQASGSGEPEQQLVENPDSSIELEQPFMDDMEHSIETNQPAGPDQIMGLSQPAGPEQTIGLSQSAGPDQIVGMSQPVGTDPSGMIQHDERDHSMDMSQPEGMDLSVDMVPPEGMDPSSSMRFSAGTDLSIDRNSLVGFDQSMGMVQPDIPEPSIEEGQFAAMEQPLPGISDSIITMDQSLPEELDSAGTMNQSLPKELGSAGTTNQPSPKESNPNRAMDQPVMDVSSSERSIQELEIEPFADPDKIPALSTTEIDPAEIPNIQIESVRDAGEQEMIVPPSQEKESPSQPHSVVHIGIEPGPDGFSESRTPVPEGVEKIEKFPASGNLADSVVAELEAELAVEDQKRAHRRKEKTIDELIAEKKLLLQKILEEQERMKREEQESKDTFDENTNEEKNLSVTDEESAQELVLEETLQESNENQRPENVRQQQSNEEHQSGGGQQQSNEEKQSNEEQQSSEKEQSGGGQRQSNYEHQSGGGQQQSSEEEQSGEKQLSWIEAARQAEAKRKVTKIAIGPAAAKAKLEADAAAAKLKLEADAAAARASMQILGPITELPEQEQEEEEYIPKTDSDTKGTDQNVRSSKSSKVPREHTQKLASEIKTMFVQNEAEIPETGAEAIPDLGGESKRNKQKTKPIPTAKELKQAVKKQHIDSLMETIVPKEMLDYYDDSVKQEKRHLTEEQKKVFSYFVPVSGMENQLSKALESVGAHLNRREAAYTGNLIIQGGQGCGKTVLATSMIRALQKETGKPNNKIGKIDAATLNKKDIQMVLRKVSGGCLIIEGAGGLSRQSAVTLSLLMDQDQSGVLVILEDTSKGIKRALAQDEGFARKFTEKISVPIFTNDDLVAFAKSYSAELGYKIDELAVLALYNRISNIQRLDQATTLTEVKDIVDEAIDREARGGLQKFFSILTAKRYSEDDRIILQEKDFE